MTALPNGVSVPSPLTGHVEFVTQRGYFAPPYVSCMFASLCMVLIWMGYELPLERDAALIPPENFVWKLHKASGAPLNEGTSIADTKQAMRTLLPDAPVLYGAGTGAEIIALLEAGAVVRVSVRCPDLTTHLRRWAGTSYTGRHSCAMGGTRMNAGVREVFWLDPMGRPALYDGEWVPFSDVTPAITTNGAGKYVATWGYQNTAVDPEFHAATPPRMSMLYQWNAATTLAQVQTAATELQYMHQTGVILRSVDWAPPGQSSLPSHFTAAWLDEFISRGITPILGAWIAQCNNTERDAVISAWNAGSGKWGGIFLDAETQWENFSTSNTTAKKANFDSFMAGVRPLTNMLGWHAYGGLAGQEPNFHHSWWNEQCDYVMPHPDTSTVSDLDSAYNSVVTQSAGWSQPAKPVWPVINVYHAADSTAAGVREDMINDAFDKSGYVALWRWYENGTGTGTAYVGYPTTGDFSETVHDMLHTIPAHEGDPPEGDPPIDPEPPPDPIPEPPVPIGGGHEVGDPGISVGGIVSGQRGTVKAGAAVIHPPTYGILYLMPNDTVVRVYGVSENGDYTGIVARTDPEGSAPKWHAVRTEDISDIHLI